jgi:DNA-binding protein YbaB
MTEHIADGLRQLYQEALRLNQTVADAERQIPSQLQGTDRSGAVLITLGSDGLPKSIEIDDEWTRRLRPEALGGAVVQAFNVTAEKRLSAWTTAFLEAENTTATAPEPAGIHSGPDVPARGATAYIGEVLDVVGNAGSFDRAAEVRGVGSVAYGKLSVTLSPGGLVACTADPGWTMQRSGSELTEAFASALAMARAELAEAGIGPDRRLVDDCVAILEVN